MSEGKRFILAHDLARERAAHFCKIAPNNWVVEFRPMTRTLAQNAKMWSMLTDVSKQIIWHERKLKNDDWKNVFSAALRGQDLVPGIDGGYVVLGQSTRAFSIQEFSDLLEIIYAFGAEHNVVFSDSKSDYIF